MSNKILDSELSEIERSISQISSNEDFEFVLNRFESIDEDYRDDHSPQLYFDMWRVALKVGKLTLANSYAKKSMKYLIDLKRIPQIKILLNDFQKAGLIKKQLSDFLIAEEILLGKRKKITRVELIYIELFSDHPEYWKFSPEFLQQYLLLEDEWNVDQWKLCYEYILINHFDKDLFLALLEKAKEKKNAKAEKQLIHLLQTKKIKLRNYKNENIKIENVNNEKLNLDYDQVAMDLLSGAIKPNQEEQRRVLNSLKFISDEELIAKGQEMIVAFELLGMEQVVFSLCEKMVSLLSDIKQKASVYYVWAQALSNLGEYYKALDLIEDVVQAQPLYGDELLAFIYLKAEAYLKLKKIKLAKELYLKIKKENPHYRLVGERLKAIEAT